MYRPYLKELKKTQIRQQVFSQFTEMAYTDYLSLSLREHGIRSVPFAFRSQYGHGKIVEWVTNGSRPVDFYLM